MAEEFYSFEKALDKLKLREEELRRLVSEGEIRAYRSGETMKLRREDVEKLQKELTVPGGSGEVVDLEDGAEELIFSEEEPAEVIAEDPGMATAQISEEDTLLVDEPKKGKKAAPAEEAIELAEEVEEAVPAPAPVRGRGAAAARRSGATRGAAAAAVEAPVAAMNAEPAVEGMGVRAALAVSAILLFVTLFAVVNMASIGKSAPMSPFYDIGKALFG